MARSNSTIVYHFHKIGARAVQDVFGLESEEIFKAATGFAGGIGSKVLFAEH